MITFIYGSYLILRAVNHHRPGEATNLGCAVYGPDGKQIGYKVDPDGIDRAIRRGDLTGWTKESLGADYCDNYLRTHPDIESVERSHGSMGHAMSVIQVGTTLPTALEPGVVEHIYERYVLGKKDT